MLYIIYECFAKCNTIYIVDITVPERIKGVQTGLKDAKVILVVVPFVGICAFFLFAFNLLNVGIHLHPLCN